MAEILTNELLPSVINYEPKLGNRWILYIQGIPSFVVKEFARPKITQKNVEIHWINKVRYVKGKTTFDSVKLTLHDPITPSGAQAVMEWIRRHHEPLTGRDGYASIYQQNIELKLIDPAGVVIESWTFYNAWIESAEFGSLDYSKSDLLDIDLTIRYDYAEMNY